MCRGILQRRGFALAPLQSQWVAERLQAAPEELLSDLRLLLADGSQLRGADAYRHVMRRIWWAYPLYLLSITPLLRKVFDVAYRRFADHRHLFSQACGLGSSTRSQPVEFPSKTAVAAAEDPQEPRSAQESQ
jgi:predicted DCC family thiol-disulfide oxidoreductase YuxK